MYVGYFVVRAVFEMNIVLLATAGRDLCFDQLTACGAQVHDTWRS
jgi:hypothetical protein